MPKLTLSARQTHLQQNPSVPESTVSPESTVGPGRTVSPVDTVRYQVREFSPIPMCPATDRKEGRSHNLGTALDSR